MSRFLRLAAMFSFPTLLAAQSTWVVDSAGGPGVNFTTIQEAVDAAADGDLVVVRGSPTAYAPAIVMKGLRIVGQPKAGLRPILAPGGYGFFVQYLQANRPCTLAGFDAVPGAKLAVLSCAAPVVLDSIGSPGAGFTVTITQVSSITVRDSTFEPGSGYSLVTAQSTVVLSRCTLLGRNASLAGGGTPALAGIVATLGTVTLVDCTVTGGLGAGSAYPGSAALGMALANATVTGLTSLTGGGSLAVEQTGVSASTLVLDPRVSVTGAIPAGVNLVVKRVPNLRLRTGATSLGIDVTQAPLGGVVAFVLGVPGQPVALGFGTLWLDPASLLDLGALGADALGAASLNLSVPSLPSAFGYRFGVQAAVVDVIAATIELTNPSATIVR